MANEPMSGKRKEGRKGRAGGGKSEASSKAHSLGSWTPCVVLKRVLSYKGDGRNAL